MGDGDRQRQRAVSPVIYDEFAALDQGPLERRILGAVIQRAIFDYLSVTLADRHHRRSAVKFLFSDDPEQSHLRLFAEYLFSDPEGVIQRIRDGLRNGTIDPKRVVLPD